MAGQGPHAGIVTPSQIYRVTVGVELLAADFEILECRIDICYRLDTEWFGRKAYPAYDAVPVGLCIFGVGMAAGINLFGYAGTVVYHDCQHMSAGSQSLRKVKLLGCGNVVRRACFHIVDIYLGRFGSLKREVYALPGPFSRNLDVAAIPGLAFVRKRSREPGGFAKIL